jgi:hypothetical protein
MLPAQPDVDGVPLGESAAKEIDRRIDGLMRVKALCGLEPAHEQHFHAVVAKARSEATEANPAGRTAALSALEVLSLELCDD